MGRLTLIVLASLLLQGQTAAPPPQGRITGRVIDDTSKAPIANARVSVMSTGRPPSGPGPQPEARSDDEGRFTIDGLEPGGYRLQVMKGGYAQAPSNGLYSSVSVSAGNAVNVSLALIRGGAIAGRVTDERGEPVVETRVVAQRLNDNGFSPSLAPVGSGAQTNDLGEFRLYGLAPGTYYVQANGLSGMPATTAMRSRLAPTFFPAAREARDATAVTVVSNATAADVNIRMAIESLFVIRGVAVDGNGRPVEGAMISVNPERFAPGAPPMMMGPFNRNRSAADGSFTIVNLPAGSYRIQAALPKVIASQAVGGGPTNFSSSMTSGAGGGGVMTSTETRNGVTTTSQYSPDQSKSVRVTIENADATGVRVEAAAPPR